MKKNLKRARVESIVNSIQPNYMITIQLPPAYKSKKLERFRFNIKNIMQQVEKELLGKKWHKHHYRFIVFYENKNELEPWHAHILGNFTDNKTGKIESYDDIENAVSRANHTFRCRNGSKNDLDIDVISLTNSQSVIAAVDYCQKEVWQEEKSVERQIRFEFSEDLFSIKKHDAHTPAL